MHEPAFRKNLARSLRRVRRERGLTQRGLAQSAGVTEKYLSRVELGLVTPSAFIAFRLCTSLGLDLGALVTAKQSAHRPHFEGAVRLLRAQPEQRVDCARRILAELFR